MPNEVRVILPRLAYLIENRLPLGVARLRPRLRLLIATRILLAAGERHIPVLALHVGTKTIKIVVLFPSEDAREQAKSFAIAAFTATSLLIRKHQNPPVKRMLEGATFAPLVDDIALAQAMNELRVPANDLTQRWKRALRAIPNRQVIADIIALYRSAARAVPKLMTRLKRPNRSKRLQAQLERSAQRLHDVTCLERRLRFSRGNPTVQVAFGEHWKDYIENNLSLTVSWLNA